MSGSDDNFLARWSRRKREVDKGQRGEAPEGAQITRGKPAYEANADPPPGSGERVAAQPVGKGPSSSGRDGIGPSPSLSPEAGEGQKAPLPQSLPRVEDLTADSDLSAFLRAGVPEDLKRAALRRMWSLDPSIRDFIGPAEYAWDFNNPDSIPGFSSAAVRGLNAAAHSVTSSVGNADAVPPPLAGEAASEVPLVPNRQECEPVEASLEAGSLSSSVHKEPQPRSDAVPEGPAVAPEEVARSAEPNSSPNSSLGRENSISRPGTVPMRSEPELYLQPSADPLRSAAAQIRPRHGKAVPR